jgi:dihydroorotase-like cyclic amidohydrolase
VAARDTWLLTDVRTRTADGPVDVAVVDGRIAAVGTDLDHPGPVVHGAGRVVLPGLVEPHLHLDKAMLGTEVVGSLDDAVADTLLDLTTHDAAALLGDPAHGVVSGARADLVLLDAPDARTGLLDRAPRTNVADLQPARTGTSRA